MAIKKKTFESYFNHDTTKRCFITKEHRKITNKELEGRTHPSSNGNGHGWKTALAVLVLDRRWADFARQLASLMKSEVQKKEAKGRTKILRW